MHFSALYLLFLLITQYKGRFFFSFIWYQIRLDMVMLKVGHALNNIKSMGEKNLIQIRCHVNPLASEAVYTRNLFSDRMSDSV